MTNLRKWVAAIAALALAACATPEPEQADLPDMGDFQLMWTIVVADNARVVPPSRTATEEEWQDVLTSEIGKRFGGYAGGRDYHIAVNVDGYALAVPGIPIVLAPKSVLVVSANVWDHELGAKLHDEPRQLTVFEGASASTIVGSGLTKSKQEQMVTLSRNAAARIQGWMLENPEWFGLPVADAPGE